MRSLILRPAAFRLDNVPQLQRAVADLHRLGPRPVAYFIGELMDDFGIPPAELDRLLEWRKLSPSVVATMGSPHDLYKTAR